MTASVRQILVLFALVVASFAVFAVWPGLDLWVTGLFYDPVERFSAAESGWPNTARMAIWRLSQALLLVAIAALFYKGVWRRNAFGLPASVWGYMLGLYVIGPGILVDLVLKPAWGRARPANVLEFGGKLTFTPPYQITDQCARNCSFVAGEVSGAVALAICLMLILAHLRDRMGQMTYRIAASAILILPIFTAWQRIAAGRHFVSDAVFAALFTLLVAVLLGAAMRSRGWIVSKQDRR